MTVELKAKLKEIPIVYAEIDVKGRTKDLVRHLDDNEIAQIDQAYKDAGYIQIPSAELSRDGYIDVFNAQDIRHNGVKLMSGQAWYERFMYELSTNMVLQDHPADARTPAYYERSSISRAARLAAGID